MALSSASTFDDAYAQINNSQSWDGNPALARDWLEAARWLTTNRPSFSMRQNAQIGWQNLEKMMERARKYVASVDSTSTARRSPFVVMKSRKC